MTTDTQEGEAVAHPLSCLPDCMMPDGADPCKGYQTLAKAFDRITEDRARFPDRPDDIGRMIEAHIGNLKSGKEAADEHARNAFAKIATLTRQLAEAREVIERQRKGLEAAEQWLSGWASAEPYISTIRAALSPPRERHPAAMETTKP